MKSVNRIIRSVDGETLPHAHCRYCGREIPRYNDNPHAVAWFERTL